MDISSRYVLFLDPILASGSSAIAALEVLLKKGVREENIIFLSIIAAPQGIHRVCTAFPKIQVVTSEIDHTLSAAHIVLPGIGEFGDRRATGNPETRKGGGGCAAEWLRGKTLR